MIGIEPPTRSTIPATTRGSLNALKTSGLAQYKQNEENIRSKGGALRTLWSLAAVRLILGHLIPYPRGGRMDLLGLVLYGAPVPILIACIVWIVRLNTSQQKGERLTLHWRDLDPVRKTLAGLIFAWLCLNLYLTVGDLLAFLNVAVLPLGPTYSIYGPIMIWASASTIVGLSFLLSIRYPRRPIVA
jgi:hypothetical protein